MSTLAGNALRTPKSLGAEQSGCGILARKAATNPTAVQIKLLRILTFLGAGDKSASENMYAVVGDAMRRANTGHTIGNAIIAECIRTVTAIYPNEALQQSGGALPGHESSPEGQQQCDHCGL